MVEYSKVNIKLSDTQLKKLKTSVKNKTGTTLKMSLKCLMEMIYYMLLATRQKTKLRNAFHNNMSTNLKLSKAQISKIIESGGFLWSLMKVAIPLAKNVLASLGITAAGSTIDERIQKKQNKTKNNNNNKKKHGSGRTTSNEFFNNFKWKNEWNNKNLTSSWRF